MALTLELSLLLLLVLGLGVWGIVTGIRQSRAQEKQQAGVLVTPQELSTLAQPYRRYLGEAVSIQRDIAKQAGTAPETLQHELGSLAARVEWLVKRALPRAQHGTSLEAYLLELKPSEPQHAQTTEAAAKVETELANFVETLKTLRGKVYQVLTDATQLSSDTQLAQDLDDALIEVSALEEAFRDVTLELP